MLNLNEVVNIQTNIGLITENLNLKEYVANAIKGSFRAKCSKRCNSGNKCAARCCNTLQPAYLESVLYNLISNAIRYSNPEKDRCKD
jgi:signal transduction histidine kinase